MIVVSCRLTSSKSRFDAASADHQHLVESHQSLRYSTMNLSGTVGVLSFVPRSDSPVVMCLEASRELDDHVRQHNTDVTSENHRPEIWLKEVSGKVQSY